MANSGTDGVSYTWGLYRELDPTFLNYVSVLSGYRPKDLEKPFSYCDLGCGNGVTINALAAVFPHAEFHGIDVDKTHIGNAAAIAEGAGLANAKFFAADFGNLQDDDYPTYDYIVLHGVYAWVDPSSRDAVRRFIGKHLNPGGVVYVSYNAMPGWSAFAPLRDAVINHTMAMGVDPLMKAQAGLDYLSFLAANDAGFFADNPPAKAFLEEIKKQDLAYVVHEFFSDQLKPYYFHQVAAEMRSVGVSFAGSAVLHTNMIDIAAPAEFHKLLRDAASRNEFEQRGDFIRNTRFRKDVYVRKDRPDLTAEEQTDLLAAIPFGLNCAPANFAHSAQFGEVRLSYESDIFLGAVEALANGARTVDQLCATPELSRYDRELLVDAMKFLTAGGQVVPFGKATMAADAGQLSAERYSFSAKVNVEFLKRRLFAAPTIGFSAPQAGTIIELPMADALFALCSVEATRNEVSSWAFQRMIEARQQLTFEEGTETEAIASAVADFRETRLPKLLELGILVPAA